MRTRRSRPLRRPPHWLALPSLLSLLTLATTALPARAADWVSYRDTYRAMVVFEKYGGPKNLLQHELEVRPAERGGLDGAQLVVSGKTTQLNLPLDALGRAVFPLQKAAYDENATLQLNRKGVSFSVRARVTIAPRADGVYDTAELRDACAQALGFARYVDASRRASQCAGVRFVFPRKVEAGARLRRADGSEQPLAAVGGTAFEGDVDDGFSVVNLRFDAASGRGQVTARQAPLAIVPVFE